MKTTLPLRWLRPSIFLTALLLSLTVLSQSGPELIFTNPVLKSGTANTQGAVYRFSNVTNGVDAEVKLRKFSRPDIVMTYVDRNDLGWDKAFQPNFGLAGLVLPYQKWYIDFEMTFYKAGTYDKQMMDTIDLTALDVDGDGRSISEYCTFENPTSIEYSTISYLTSQVTGILGQIFTCECGKSSPLVHCSNCGGDGITNSGSGNNNECQNCEGSGFLHDECDHAYQGTNGNTVNGPVQNYVDIDTSATQVMATYQYRNKDKIKFRYGAQSGALSSNGSGIRLNSTWFRKFSLAPASSLPVKLSNFTAILNKSKVDLKWLTQSEKNVSHFEIERSVDGVNYKQAGIMFAYGNTSETKSYSFPDDITNVRSNIIYYRLRSMDIDGKSEYSQVRIIRISKKNETNSLIIYPNPVNNELRATVPSLWQGKEVLFEVFNQNGIKIKSVKTGNASQTETIALRELSNGLYMIKATCGSETAQQKIIKN